MKNLALTTLLILLASSSVSNASPLGIVGQDAPEFGNLEWFDKDGNRTAPIKLQASKGKIVFLNFFQSWCPGCLSLGLPSLKAISEKYKDNSEVVFFAIQTVFEGKSVNTIDKVLVIKEKFKLNIKMAHDDGVKDGSSRSLLMQSYRSGGTPWAVIISQEGKVVFNDFHISKEDASRIIDELLREK